MPLVREPKPLPSELGYVPPGSTPYKVATNDSWWTLVDRPDVTFSKMTALDLCYFNFRTRKPTEVNWTELVRGSARAVRSQGCT